MPREQFWSILAVVVVSIAGCGGGGGGGASFAVAGVVPRDGSVDASISDALAITFNFAVDVASVDPSTMRLERTDGSLVVTRVVQQGATTTTVRLQPLINLAANTRYRLIIGAGVLSAEGNPLGAPQEVCFLTTSPTPTVRPDQIVDLGDRLQVARYLSRSVRTAAGRVFVIGGFRNDQTATDTIEEWDSATRTFRLLPSRMSSPRAEHSATLLSNGTIFIAGGVATPGGEPLATTDVFDPSGGGVGPGPDMNVARTWHGASQFRGGETVMVSGGFGVGGAMLNTVEFREGNRWEFLVGALPTPTARHIQFGFEFDHVYFGSSNDLNLGALYDGVNLTARLEPDIRFRAAMRPVQGGYLIVGGDTRSAVFYDPMADRSSLASDLTRERRGAHTLTPRGPSGTRFLVAGGFNIARFGIPALASMEIADFSPGAKNTQFNLVVEVELPIPFAGHVGFRQSDGATVLAGGWLGDVGEHSRRVVMVLDETSTPPLTCD